MNRGPSNDRISAYFDREIPSADRETIVTELQENPALQQTLDDFQTLSTLLEDQPFHAAPAELHQLVMDEVYQEFQRSPAPRISPRISQGISPRLFAASLITTAALMLVLSQLALLSQSKSFQLTMREQEQNLNDDKQKELLAQNDSWDRRWNDFQSIQRRGDGNSRPLFNALRAPLSTPYASKRALDFAHIKPSPILAAYDNEAFRKATPQELFDRFSKKWSEVNLVRLRVSDIDKGEETFQRLVAELGIDKTWGEIYHSSEMEPIIKPNGYKAIFVQATHPQLKKLLENLQHVENDQIFMAMTIHNAIPVSGLDYESQYRINNPMIGPLMPVVPFRKLKNKPAPQLQFRSASQSVLESYAAQFRLHLPSEILDLETVSPKPQMNLLKATKKTQKSKEEYLLMRKDGRDVWSPRPIRTVFIFTDK